MIKKIGSLAELRQLAQKDPQYARLAIIAASNLGGNTDTKTLDGAMKWLTLNAQETDEDGVVQEINFCRDLLT